MDEIEFENKSFSLEIGAVDSSVNILNSDKTAVTEENKTFTFTLTANFAVVNSQTKLGADDIDSALTSENSYNTIYIDSDIELTKPVSIEKDVTIESLNKVATQGINTISSENTKTINITGNENNVLFTVEEGKAATISDLKLAGSKQAGIEVKDGATLTASDLTYDGETYENPTVKASKTNATVNLTDSTSQLALKIEKEKITKYEDLDSGKSDSFGDKRELDSDYNYYNYYNKEENSKIYTTVFYNYEGRQIAEFRRYNFYNDKIKPPTNESPFELFYQFKYDGYTYDLLGFTENKFKTAYYNYQESTLPEGVSDKNALTATEDKHYYAAYKLTLPENVRKVKNAEELKSALEEESITEIYIDTESEIDITDANINITRSLSITGPAAKAKLKVKNIKITADNVFLNRLNITFTEQVDDALISVTNDAQEFTLWSSSLSNESPVKYAIKYSGMENAIVDVRWNSFAKSKISDSFIYIDSALMAGTDIYSNTFAKLNSEEIPNKDAAVTIKKFNNSDILADTGETNIRIGANTFDNEGYAIKILKDASDSKTKISLDTSAKIELAVEYDDNNKNFGGIELDANISNVTVKYVNGEQESTTPPEGVTGIKFVSEFVMEDTEIQEKAFVEGLDMDGDAYSGILTDQNEDGKFYLPVTLTSNDFQDNVSTVKVTNPNGDTQTYTYSSSNNNGIATVSNAKTMKLQLEAVKSSNITGENGKVYNLELDPDGANSDKYEIKKYTIDYSKVQTQEEIINNAAKNTRRS